MLVFFLAKNMIFILINLKICLRSGSFKLLLYFGLACITLALMMSAFAGRQPQTLFVDFAFSTLRVTFCLASLLWVQELLVKPIESKNIVQYLAYPIARVKYLYSVFVSVAFAVAIAVIVFAVATFLCSFLVAEHQQSTQIDFGLSYFLMWGFMYLDLLVVLGFAFLIAVLSSTPFLAVAVGMGFYIAGHSIQQMLDLLSIAAYIDGREFFQMVLEVIRYVIPDLSSLDVRHWSLYDEPVNWNHVLSKLASGISYSMLAVILAALSFKRREIV